MAHILFVSRQAYGVLSGKDDGVVFGGAEVQMTTLARYMRQVGHQVGVVVRTYQPPFETVIDGIKVINYAKRKNKGLIGADSFVSFIKTVIKQNPDIVVFRLKEKVFFLAVIYTKVLRKKVVYMIAHDDTISPQAFAGFEGKVFSWCLSVCDVVFVQNTFQQESFQKRFNKTAELLPNSFFLNQKTSAHKDYALWVGRSDDWKRPEVFLELAKNNPQEKFVMVCTKSNDITRWQQVRIAAQKIPNLTFKDYVAFDENQALYDQAKIFVNTSTTEGFPNSFINCGVAETPIISLAVNPNEIFTKHTIGIFAHNSTTELQKGFTKLLQDANFYNTSAKGITSYTHTTHDINKNGKRFNQKLTDLLLKK